MTNIIQAVFGASKSVQTRRIWKIDHGMKLRIVGIDLPTAYQVHFANVSDSGQAIPVVATSDTVDIPDQYLQTGKWVYAWIYLTPEEGIGYTEYMITIPVAQRPEVSSEEPTPVQQSAIDQAIGALNQAVEQTAEDVASASASAEGAEASSQAAEASAEAAASSAGSASQSATAASSAQAAAESARTAAETARDSASGYADTAAQSASQASQSASQASQSASQASQSASEAATSASQAQSIADNIQQTVDDALQEAKDSGEFDGPPGPQGEPGPQGNPGEGVAAGGTTGQMLVKSSDTDYATEWTDPPQVEVTQAEFDALKEYVYDMSPVTTVGPVPVVSVSDSAPLEAEGLIANIEPVQDLHGYDYPWPEGGGVNQFDPSDATPVSKGRAFNMTVLVDETEETITASGSASWSASGGSFSFALVDVTKNYTGLVGTAFVVSKSSNITSVNSVSYSNGAIVINATVTANGTTSIVLKISFTSTSQTAWSPYSNICPITGWTGAKVAKCGKNLLDNKKYQYTATQVRIGTDGSSDYNYMSRGIYTLSVTANVDTTVYYRIEGADAIRIGMNGGTFELEQDALVCFYCYRSGSLSVDDITQWQIELGSTATEYEPYNGSTYDITFPSEAGTVYGGTLDVVKGVCTVTHMLFEMNSSTMNNSDTYPGWRDAGVRAQGFSTENYSNVVGSVGNRCAINTSGLSNDILYLPKSVYGFEQPEWIAMAVDVQFVLPLPTPITYQLTPQEIAMLRGNNTIFADCGDTTLTYRQDVGLLLEALTQPDESDMVASTTYAANSFFTIGGTLYRATTAIATGETIQPGVNCVATTVADQLTAIYARL